MYHGNYPLADGGRQLQNTNASRAPSLHLCGPRSDEAKIVFHGIHELK